MTRTRLIRAGLATAIAATALAVPATASAKPANGIYQGAIGDDPHESGTVFVGTAVHKVRKKRVRVQEITAAQVTVQMLCDERFGQSISEVPYTFRHIQIVRKRASYTYSMSLNVYKTIRVRRHGRRVKRRVSVRHATMRGVIRGDVVAGTLRIDELRRRGTEDGFGALSATGPVHCTTDSQSFLLPLTPGDLLAPSPGEQEDGSLPA